MQCRQEARVSKDLQDGFLEVWLKAWVMLQDFPEGNVLGVLLGHHYLRFLDWDMSLDGSLWTTAAPLFLVSQRCRDLSGVQGYNFWNATPIGSVLDGQEMYVLGWSQLL